MSFTHNTSPDPDPQIAPLVLSVTETCRAGNWSRGTVYKKIAEGRLDARKDGKRTKITVESIRNELASLPRLANEAAQ